VLRERESLARDGIVVVQLEIDKHSGKLRGNPNVISRGFVYKPEAEALLAEAQARIRQAVAAADGGDLAAAIERELSKLFYAETKRRPMVIVLPTAVG
jgi:ribonuclease J